VIPSLERRQFGYGSGMISPNQMMFIVDIPKNASSFLNLWLSQYGWGAAVARNHEHRISEMIVILRDPLDRWISGISQYLNGWILHAKSFDDIKHAPRKDHRYLDAESFISCYNTVTERLIFDNLERYDDHVWPQSEIIQNLLPSKNKRFFCINHGWEDRLAQHLGLPGPQNVDKNSASQHRDQQILQDFFRARIKDDPNLENMIVNRYRRDYELIEEFAK